MNIHRGDGTTYRAYQLQGIMMVPLFPQPADAAPITPTAPVISTTDLGTITQHQAFNLQLVASGTSPITWSVATGTLPSGLSLSTNGILIGTPTVAESYTFTVAATNSAGSTTQVYSGTVEVGATIAPTITSTDFGYIVQDTAYTQQLTASGTGPFTWTVSSGALPAGLSLSTTGIVSGTPSVSGAYSVGITATNPAGSSSHTFTGSIEAAPATDVAPAITTTTLSALSQGSAFSQQLVASGTTPITWTVSSGTLPSGLTLSSSGTLAGTPSTSGSYNFTVQATNSAGSGTQVYTGTVGTAPVVVPTITTTTLSSLSHGSSFSQQLAASGDTPITWTVSSGTVPAGLTLSSSGTLSGTPSTSGSYNFTVQATNSGGSDTQVYTGTVNAAPLITTMAQNLVVPWSIVFLPTGEMLVAERNGKLNRYGANPRTWTINVGTSREGGLMGVVLHPNFATNKLLYAYYTVPDASSNQIDQFQLNGDNLVFQTTILSNMPADAIHNGGVMKFGPDGKLYVCVGDANIAEAAQDLGLMKGKILRMNPDGTAPADNPFVGVAGANPRIWTLGHRNPQGIAWNTDGRMWATEHGPFPGEDEINLIEKGKNYGWPAIHGSMTQSGMVTPVLQSTTAVTWAPSGCDIYNNVLYFGAMRGQALYAVQLNGANVGTVNRHFYQTYGRIRAVTVHNGLVYMATSNNGDANGAGSLKPNDDHVFRVNPALL